MPNSNTFPRYENRLAQQVAAGMNKCGSNLPTSPMAAVYLSTGYD
jgi:hypothetical protein